MAEKKLKVLQVLPALNGGGVERGTLEIAKALVAEGHESWVLSSGGRLVAELEQAGSKHITWDIGRKSLFTLLQVNKVRRWLVSAGFDVVHVRSRMPAWVVWLAWRKMPKDSRPKLVSTVHGLHSVSRYSEIMCCGERVIAVSKSVQQYIEQNYPRVDLSKVELVYRGVDPGEFPFDYQPDEEWKSQFYKQYPSLKDTCVVTLPGRMTRLKGHLDFIEIIQGLKQAGLAIKGLVVGGEDPKRKNYAEEVYQKVKDSGLENDIVFAGHRQDIKEIYGVSDVVLSLSSKPESFGRTVLEPLSMGVPVLGYAHGGVGEILKELCPDGAVTLFDKSALIERIKCLAKGETLTVKENSIFLLEKMKQQTLAIYRDEK